LCLSQNRKCFNKVKGNYEEIEESNMLLKTGTSWILIFQFKIIINKKNIFIYLFLFVNVQFN